MNIRTLLTCLTLILAGSATRAEDYEFTFIKNVVSFNGILHYSTNTSDARASLRVTQRDFIAIILDGRGYELSARELRGARLWNYSTGFWGNDFFIEYFSQSERVWKYIEINDVFEVETDGNFAGTAFEPNNTWSMTMWFSAALSPHATFYGLGNFTSTNRIRKSPGKEPLQNFNDGFRSESLTLSMYVNWLDDARKGSYPLTGSLRYTPILLPITAYPFYEYQ